MVLQFKAFPALKTKLLPPWPLPWPWPDSTGPLPHQAIPDWSKAQPVAVYVALQGVTQNWGSSLAPQWGCSCSLVGFLLDPGASGEDLAMFRVSGKAS